MQEHIIISKDRSVNVPESIRKIGVQYDHNVNTLTFDCPRYSAGGVDLSKLIFYVNYLLPDNTPGSSRLENITVDTEDSELIHFDWVIRRAVTGQEGFLKCLICAKKSDSEGTETNHWNTDLFNTMYVTEGLETEAEIEEENKDLITQLLLEMDTTDENLLNLSNRVGELSNLTTDDKSSVVAAVNEVKGETTELKGDLDYASHKIMNPFNKKGIIDIKQPFEKGNINDYNPPILIETPLSDGSQRYYTGKIKVKAGDLIYTNIIEFMPSEGNKYVHLFNNEGYVSSLHLYEVDNTHYFIIPENVTSFAFNTNFLDGLNDFSQLEIYKVYFDFDSYTVGYGSLTNNAEGIVQEWNTARIHLKIKPIENSIIYLGLNETAFVKRKDAETSNINTENGIVQCTDNSIEYIGINICSPSFTIDISELASYRYITEIYDNKYMKNSIGYLTKNDIDDYETTLDKEITVDVIDFCNDGISDDDAILNAIEFSKQFEKRVIVFSNKDFYISKAIELPSNTTVIIDGITIKQTDYVTDNIFRGDNLVIDYNNFYGFPTEVKHLKNIKIIGKNGAKIIGCDNNKTYDHPLGTQEMLGDFYGWRLLQISLSYCDGIEISGISFSNTKSWCISFDKCKNGHVHDLIITSNVKNGDGIDLRCGCNNFIVENISGSTSDDTVACTALKGTSPYVYPDGKYIFPMEPTEQFNDNYSMEDLSIHDVIIRNISTVGNHHGVILLSGDNLQVYNISIDKIIESDDSGHREALVKIYSGYGAISSDNSIHDIRINNVKSKSATYALLVNTKINETWCNKISNEKVGGTNYSLSNSDGIIITNS